MVSYGADYLLKLPIWYCLVIELSRQCSAVWYFLFVRSVEVCFQSMIDFVLKQRDAYLDNHCSRKERTVGVWFFSKVSVAVDNMSIKKKYTFTKSIIKFTDIVHVYFRLYLKIGFSNNFCFDYNSLSVISVMLGYCFLFFSYFFFTCHLEISTPYDVAYVYLIIEGWT